jgi:hypothetical protein
VESWVVLTFREYWEEQVYSCGHKRDTREWSASWSQIIKDEAEC